MLDGYTARGAKLDVRILQVTDCHIVSEEGREILGTDTFRSLQLVLETALAKDR